MRFLKPSSSHYIFLFNYFNTSNHDSSLRDGTGIWTDMCELSDGTNKSKQIDGG